MPAAENRDASRKPRANQTMQPGELPTPFAGGLHKGAEAIPGYRLEAFLGRGQYGEVWSAEGPGRVSVALKFIDLRGAQGAKEFRGIQRVKAIRHAHLMPITGLWMIGDDGQVVNDDELDDYMPAGALLDTVAVTETLEKNSRPRLLVVAMLLAQQSLEERVKECRQQGKSGIPREELLTYMEEAAKGIDYLNTPRHDLGDGPVSIQHCDIKPANLVLVGNSVLVCDFGLARLLGDVTTTATGVLGSLAYMAPESIARRPGRAVDQYALAITYYELLSGGLPFAAEDFTSVVDAHRSGSLDFSFATSAEQKVLRRATSVEAESRFANCNDLVRALRAAAEGTSFRESPQAETPTATENRRDGDKRRSRRRLAALAATGVMLLACTAGALATLTLLAPPRSETIAAPSQRSLSLQPAASRIFLNGASIEPDASGRFPLPAELKNPFELRIPTPDEEHADFTRTLSIEQLSRSGFLVEYQFEKRPNDHVTTVTPATPAAQASQAARRALELVEAGYFDEAARSYRQAIQLDEQYAVQSAPFLLPTAEARCLAVSPDGRWLFTGGIGGRLLRWDLDNLTAPPASLADSLSGVIYSVAVSPEGRWVACGTSSGELLLCATDSDSGEALKLLSAQVEIRTIAFSPDDRFLAVATAQDAVVPAAVHLWKLDEAEQETTHRLLEGHRENINALAFSHDNQWLYSGGFDNRVLRWGLAEDASHPTEIHNGRGDIQSIACHPHQAIVVFGGIGPEQHLWLLEAPGARPRELGGRLGDVETVAFSGDGSRLTAADQDGYTLVWSQGDFTAPMRLERHLGLVAAAQFDPTGDWLATASWDETVGLWNLRAPTKTPLTLSHDDKLVDVCVSSNGRHLATLAEDGIVRVWSLPQCRLLKQACDDLERIPLPRGGEHHDSREPRRSSQQDANVAHVSGRIYPVSSANK